MSDHLHDAADDELLARAARGDRAVLDELFEKHRERLHRMVSLRMPPDLRGRVDASDVLQEAFLDAVRRLPAYIEEKPSMPFFLWLRFLTRQKLLALHRHHVGTKARDPRREVPLRGRPMPDATSEALAARLLGDLKTPSEEAIRAEQAARLRAGLDALDPHEREILSLRHFEQLSNSEAARELEISEAAASKRYIRAAARLRGILEMMNMRLSSL